MSIPEELWRRFQEGDPRALARALTLVESGHPAGRELLKRVRGKGRAKVVGVTGSPGAGKSTLTDRLILGARKRGERVAVLAVDPSSPFSGGAILGDRIRMMRHHQDPGVYIRSMASRGALGGLAGATVAALSLLEAFGFDRIFVETVGVGQSEVDIARVADTTLLVLTPAAGDAVQAFKAGVMEIADVFAVNKFDLPGGERIVQELKSALELSPPRPGGGALPSTPRWRPAARGWRPSLRASGPTTATSWSTGFWRHTAWSGPGLRWRASSRSGAAKEPRGRAPWWPGWPGGSSPPRRRP